MHKGKIYVIGQYSSTSILEYDEALDLWNPIDSVIETYDETIAVSYTHLTLPTICSV